MSLGSKWSPCLKAETFVVNTYGPYFTISRLKNGLFLQVKLQGCLTDYKGKQNKDLKLLVILSVSKSNLSNTGHSPRECCSNLSAVMRLHTFNSLHTGSANCPKGHSPEIKFNIRFLSKFHKLLSIVQCFEI